MTRDEYVSAVKSAFISIGKDAAMKYLISKVPFFGLSWVNPIAAYVIGYVVEGLADSAELLIFFEYIDFRTTQQGRDFVDSALKNKIAQEKGSADEKKNAEDDLKNKLRSFVKLNN